MWSVLSIHIVFHSAYNKSGDKPIYYLLLSGLGFQNNNSEAKPNELSSSLYAMGEDLFKEVGSYH